MKPQEDSTTVLIIDDEEAMRDSCQQILAKEGYQVVTAIDGPTGLQMIKQYKPHMVLVDLKMPGISGQEVLERITRIDQTIATVVITGYATVSSAIEAMRYGAYDFLPKPFTPEELRNVTRRALDRRRAFVEAAAASKEKSETTRYFLSMIGHEVVSPLKEIRKNLNRVERELPPHTPSPVRENLAYCTTTIERMIHLVEKWQKIL